VKDTVMAQLEIVGLEVRVVAIASIKSTHVVMGIPT